MILKSKIQPSQFTHPIADNYLRYENDQESGFLSEIKKNNFVSRLPKPGKRSGFTQRGTFIWIGILSAILEPSVGG